MITLNFIHLILFLLCVLVGGLVYYILKLKKEHKQEMEKLEDSHFKQLQEIERLAKERNAKVEEKYQSTIDQLADEISFYQSYMVNMSTTINLAEQKLKEVDLRGTFEADDEIGFFFKTVKEIQKILSEFKVTLLDRK